MNPRTIWHVDSAAFVCLKAQLQLEGLQRQGWLRCACSGPFQMYLDGKLIGSGPGGELTQVPAWERFEIDTATASPSTSVLMACAPSGPRAGGGRPPRGFLGGWGGGRWTGSPPPRSR